MPEPLPITLRQARREDVAAIVRLLADDHLGGDREQVGDPPHPAYLAAFDRIAADPGNLLAVAEDEDGQVVGTMQLTFIPGLSNQGATLMMIEAVRVESRLRGGGLGRIMIGWALDEGRRRGCRFVELLSHSSREAAHRFYERLGFARSHLGMKREL